MNLKTTYRLERGKEEQEEEAQGNKAKPRLIDEGHKQAKRKRRQPAQKTMNMNEGENEAGAARSAVPNDDLKANEDHENAHWNEEMTKLR